jgi:hypothetical protein
MFIEEATIPATHLMVADHPAFANANGAQIFKTIQESTLINPSG